MPLYVDTGYWDDDYAEGEGRVDLAGAGCAQRNLSAEGGIVQHHLLGGSVCLQRNTSTAGEILIDEESFVTLSGEGCTQRNTCTSGAIVQINIVYDYWLQPGAGKTWTPPNPLRP